MKTLLAISLMLFAYGAYAETCPVPTAENTVWQDTKVNGVVVRSTRVYAPGTPCAGEAAYKHTDYVEIILPFKPKG